MLKKLVILAVALLVTSPCLGQDLADRSDRQLKQDLRKLEREVRKLEKLDRSLVAAGRSSSNADRSSAVQKTHAHMTDILHDRERKLGQDHTIIRHGGTVETGLTDAAKLGSPVANKETRRRLRKGTEEGMSAELMRLIAMRSYVVTSGLIYQQAIERQGDAFEQFLARARDFAAVLATEEAIILNEMARRAGTISPDSLTVSTEEAP